MMKYITVILLSVMCLFGEQLFGMSQSPENNAKKRPLVFHTFQNGISLRPIYNPDQGCCYRAAILKPEQRFSIWGDMFKEALDDINLNISAKRPKVSVDEPTFSGTDTSSDDSSFSDSDSSFDESNQKENKKPRVNGSRVAVAISAASQKQTKQNQRKLFALCNAQSKNGVTLAAMPKNKRSVSRSGH